MSDYQHSILVSAHAWLVWLLSSCLWAPCCRQQVNPRLRLVQSREKAGQWGTGMHLGGGGGVRSCQEAVREGGENISERLLSVTIGVGVGAWVAGLAHGMTPPPQYVLHHAV